MLKFDNTKGELGNLSKIRKPVESLCVTRMIGLYKSTAEKNHLGSSCFTILC